LAEQGSFLLPAVARGITGSVDFSAASTGQYHTIAGTTITGAATFSNSDVTTALSFANTLSTTLGAEAGTPLVHVDSTKEHPLGGGDRAGTG